MQMTIYSKNLAENFADNIYKLVRFKPKNNENEYGKHELNYLNVLISMRYQKLSVTWNS